MNRKKPLRLNITNVNSLLTAMALIEVSVCQILTLLFGISSPFIFLGIALVVLSLIVNHKIYVKSRILVVYFVLLVTLLFSYLLNGKVVLNYLTTFAVFGLICIVLVPYKINHLEVLKAASIIIFIRCLTYLFKQRSVITSLNVWDFDKVQMPIAFEFSAAFVISLTLLFAIDNVKKFLLIIIPNLIISFIVVFFDCHTRGAIVAIGFGILMLIIQHMKKGKVAAVVMISLITLFLYSNIISVLSIIIHLLGQRGINLPVLDKTFELISQNNIGNGRSALFAKAVMAIQQSPIIGHGVGYFEKVSSGQYTHNYFLQILCEFGIVGLIFAIIFLTVIIGLIFKINTKPICKYVALLFSLNITLLTSGVYWTSFVYIYFMFYFIDKYDWQTKTLLEF